MPRRECLCCLTSTGLSQKADPKNIAGKLVSLIVIELLGEHVLPFQLELEFSPAETRSERRRRRCCCSFFVLGRRD